MYNKYIKYFLVSILFSSSLFSAKVTNDFWKKGLDFETYLKKYKISKDIINLMDKDDAQLIAEINPNRRFYEMVASNGVLLQTLIPIGEELQLHLFRTPRGYKVELIPIAYQKDTFVALLSIDQTPHSDIIKKVKNRKLANEFTRLMKHSVNFRSIQKNDKLAIVYDQKMRLGQPIGIPDIKVAMVESHATKHYVFKHTDGKYYDENGKELVKKYMRKPLNHIRITSPFTNRRWHPILHRYKAHLGVDFGARRGTPILAAADGKVIFSGWMGGYGNVIKIKHSDGYVTLYAHQSRRKAKVGQRVKKGQVIGFVGSTGRSTGPHLHFGLYKNGRPINPMSMVKFSSKGLVGKGKRAFLKRKRRYTKIINKIFEENRPSYVWNTVQERQVSPRMKNYYKKIGW
ncbi:MAG TPA: M23 family metallopeptidase [Campylobacterales bacterium]|nr:M23 family metallopeptidase [Campylobacterales bacterium]